MNRKAIRGQLHSEKMNRTIAFHTALQRDYILVLEYDSDVFGYETHPFEIPLETGSLHTPDFGVEYENGSNHIVDCEYEIGRSGKANARRRDVEKYCRERHIEYRIILHEEMWSDYLILNLKTMFACRRYQVDDQLREHILERLSLCPVWTAGQLIDDAKDVGLSAGVYSLLVLARQGVIDMDLRSRELSRLTQVSVSP